MHSADVDLHCRYMQVSHYYYMHKPRLHDTIWIHVIWIRMLCKRGYICMCTHTRIPSVVALFGRQLCFWCSLTYQITQHLLDMGYMYTQSRITYVYRSFHFDTHSQLYQSNSELLVSVTMINIRYGLVLIILLVLVELCAGQLCTTNYCCQYCNYY